MLLLPMRGVSQANTSKPVMSKFMEKAQDIHQGHVFDGPARCLEEQGARHDDGCRLRAGDRDIDPVEREQKGEVAWHLLAAGGRHRYEADWRLLTLELVDRADADIRWQCYPECVDLRVVWGDDENVSVGDHALRAFPVPVYRTHHRLDLPANGCDFLG